MTKSFLILCFLFTIYSPIETIVVDDFFCKIPTCRAFYLVNELFILIKSIFPLEISQGLRHLPRYKSYEETCYDTVFALQAIPRQHGKCINIETEKLHPPCICMSSALIFFLFHLSSILQMHWQKQSKNASVNYMISVIIKHDIIAVIH